LYSPPTGKLCGGRASKRKYDIHSVLFRVTAVEPPKVIIAPNLVQLPLPADYKIELALTESAGTALRASIPAVWKS
jgi:hypothetical protein